MEHGGQIGNQWIFSIADLVEKFLFYFLDISPAFRNSHETPVKGLSNLVVNCEKDEWKQQRESVCGRRVKKN